MEQKQASDVWNYYYISSKGNFSLSNVRTKSFFYTVQSNVLRFTSTVITLSYYLKLNELGFYVINHT